MSGWTNSVVMICAAADLDASNSMAAAIGHTEFEFSVPLGDGVSLTHYGCCPWAQGDFVAMLAGVGQGELPPADWAAFGLTESDVFGLMSRMIVSVRPGGDPGSHFDEVLAEHSLQRM